MLPSSLTGRVVANRAASVRTRADIAAGHPCFTSDGADLAAKLAENGILCGQPTQAGSTYKSCP